MTTKIYKAVRCAKSRAKGRRRKMKVTTATNYNGLPITMGSHNEKLAQEVHSRRKFCFIFSVLQIDALQQTSGSDSQPSSDDNEDDTLHQPRLHLMLSNLENILTFSLCNFINEDVTGNCKR